MEGELPKRSNTHSPGPVYPAKHVKMSKTQEDRTEERGDGVTRSLSLKFVKLMTRGIVINFPCTFSLNGSSLLFR